jgi:EPS-associated MarR family transcriptional regulator
MDLRTQRRDDLHFRLLRLIEQHPEYSQRDHAAALGVSLSKINYVIKALIDKGHIKVSAFQHSGGKLDKIAYLLTPEGFQNRLALTRDYIERKSREYDDLRDELAKLQEELRTLPDQV